MYGKEEWSTRRCQCVHRNWSNKSLGDHPLQVTLERHTCIATPAQQTPSPQNHSASLRPTLRIPSGEVQEEHKCRSGCYIGHPKRKPMLAGATTNHPAQNRPPVVCPALRHIWNRPRDVYVLEGNLRLKLVSTSLPIKRNESGDCSGSSSLSGPHVVAYPRCQSNANHIPILHFQYSFRRLLPTRHCFWLQRSPGVL